MFTLNEELDRTLHCKISKKDFRALQERFATPIGLGVSALVRILIRNHIDNPRPLEIPQGGGKRRKAS